MKSKCLDTPLGLLEIIVDNDSLVYCNWVQPDCLKKKKKIVRTLQNKEKDEEESLLEKINRQLRDYFEGRRFGFEITLNLKGTPFQIKVWQKLLEIPYGETITYQDLASALGNSAASRAVANACGANPFAVIIPCHRVIKADGKIGGYTGGKAKKLRLLALEKMKHQ